MKPTVEFPITAQPLPVDIVGLHSRMRRMEWIARTQAQLAGLDFDLDGFMQSVIDRFPEMTPAEGVVVELVDGDDMVYRAASAHLSQFLGMRIGRAGSLSGLCVEQARTLYAADTEEDPRVDREASRQVGLRSMVCAPLIAGARVLGALKAVSALPHRFGDDDLETLDLLAKTIATALSKQLDYDALRAQTELFESSFLHAPIGKALVGLDGRFLKVNDAFGAIVGRTAEEMLGVTFQDITHPEDLDRDLELLAELRAGQRAAYRMDKRYRHRDGALVWVALSVSMVRDAAGAPDYYIAQVEDLTARMEQEAALVAAKAEAEDAAAIKGQFLANMSHEIRTPMTAVIGFSSLLLDRDDLHAEVRVYGERINFAGRALLALVNDILDFSKLEAGETTLHPKDVDVRAAAEQTLALFLPQAEAKGLKLDFDARDVAHPVVSIDPQAFGQVLTNLIGNAVKFTDAGEVKVRLAQVGEHLRVTVADSGPGLDEQQQSLLFKRFSQVDGSTTRRHGGTGLGLAISKALVEIMGGEIGVSSRPGEGSAFHFEVSAPPADDALAAAEARKPVLQHIRVLVVDDNRDNRFIARTILEAAGAEATTAQDGLEAVEIAQALPLDLILMDLRMPRLGGREALARIRGAHGPNTDIPVLAFSAGDGAEEDGAGFDGWIAKPLTAASLLGGVAAALDVPTAG